jgi:uncharacterized protein (TIGR03382 family)
MDSGEPDTSSGIGGVVGSDAGGASNDTPSGSASPGNGAGCACRLGSLGDSNAPTWAIFFAGLALARRRRR